MDGTGGDTNYDKPNIDVFIFHITEANGRATNIDIAQIPAILHSVLSNIFKEV